MNLSGREPNAHETKVEGSTQNEEKLWEQNILQIDPVPSNFVPTRYAMYTWIFCTNIIAQSWTFIQIIAPKVFRSPQVQKETQDEKMRLRVERHYREHDPSR